MSRVDPNSRLAALLVPVFAMRRHGDHGIGDTEAAKETIAFCAAHQIAVLQILPIHETVGDHSPYNPISSRALSPALLTLSEGAVPGMSAAILAEKSPESWLAQLRAGPVKHTAVHALKLECLLAAWQAFSHASQSHAQMSEFVAFEETHASWLPAYTLFRLLIEENHGNTHWQDWRPEHWSQAAAETWLAAHSDRERMESQRRGFAFIQWVAWRQWRDVKSFADEHGVKLLGEMSFGVSKSSADAWANPDLFDVNWSMGTRPVVYFDTNKDSERLGQNWGLPPYRWENHRSRGFEWLRGRIESEREFFHFCRLDHLRGYFRAYMFPWSGGAKHSEFAKLTDAEILEQTGGLSPRFLPGPDEDPTTAAMNDLQGREIISVMQEAAGDMGLYAEIMGAMPDYMRKAIDDLGVANLTFPLLERQEDRTLLPVEAYRKLSLVSYANHDHAPLAAQYSRLIKMAVEEPESNEAKDLTEMLKLAAWQGDTPHELNAGLLEGMQRALFATPCVLAGLMSSDLLGIPQRFNLPGTFGADTWNERLEHSWSEYEVHPVYGSRIKKAEELIVESGRAARR
ncbi:4-alpha-glucanotransferase [Roseimicrobium gellanilyticum]|uniref:4-alpha-glucanotransferase n=1 Tax=Roseimicrobium gellanilyticum TaxID=748857 RepID=A0A366HQL4_9BACT|nr:4-alpha-glucanotransferase [Roseimicrobium gellanilyticum]RBP45965.1 4-alpha-glucanotransferase [Roseimicrobium gellanilyticum]